MNKILHASVSALVAVVIAAGMTSCADSYNIQGSSNVSTLDGRMLYLKVLKDGEFKNIDSSEVVHGQFAFNGTIDSVRMANIFMDDENLLPIVIEDGDAMVKIDNTQQTVSGTPLNDKLYAFLKKFNQLESRKIELVHKHDRALMNGQDENVINQEINVEAMKIEEEADKLLTGFVVENFDNALGPGVFFMRTITNEIPLLDPWIEDIMSKATDKFKNDPYVKDYYQKAQENQNIMNGMKDVPMQAPQSQTPVPAGPTPNELAKPAE